MLALEGIESCQTDVQCGQSYRHHTVPETLRQVEGTGQSKSDVLESLAIAHGTCSRTLRVGFGVVTRGEVVLVVRCGSIVHTCREALRRTCLGILAMCPGYLEVGNARLLLILVDGLLETHVQTTRELVSHLVVHASRYAPRTLGVDIGQNLEIHVVVDSKVVSALAEIETAFGLIAIGRHDKTALITMREGEETVWHGKWQGHILHHQVSRTEDDVLSRAHLGTGHLQVEVRMLCIAGSVLTTVQVHHARTIPLALVRGHETLTLLCVDVGNESLSRLEVVGDAVGLILLVALLEEGFAYHLTQTVLSSCRMHQTAVQGYGYLVGGKRQVLVIHLTVSVEICPALEHVERDTVGSRVHNRGIQRTLAIRCSISLERVLCPLCTVHIDGVSLHAVKSSNFSQGIRHQHGISGGHDGVVHASIY